MLKGASGTIVRSSGAMLLCLSRLTFRQISRVGQTLTRRLRGD